MPELPEVEVVRRGLERHIVPSRIVTIDVLHDRAVRRHMPGALDLAGRLRGQAISGARRNWYLHVHPDREDPMGITKYYTHYKTSACIFPLTMAFIHSTIAYFRLDRFYRDDWSGADT